MARLARGALLKLPMELTHERLIEAHAKDLQVVDLKFSAKQRMALPPQAFI
jgi:hypothetical protein